MGCACCCVWWKISSLSWILMRRNVVIHTDINLHNIQDKTNRFITVTAFTKKVQKYDTLFDQLPWKCDRNGVWPWKKFVSKYQTFSQYIFDCFKKKKLNCTVFLWNVSTLQTGDLSKRGIFLCVVDLLFYITPITFPMPIKFLLRTSKVFEKQLFVSETILVNSSLTVWNQASSFY